jgi:hypothetical protein
MWGVPMIKANSDKSVNSRWRAAPHQWPCRDINEVVATSIKLLKHQTAFCDPRAMHASDAGRFDG